MATLGREDEPVNKKCLAVEKETWSCYKMCVDHFHKTGLKSVQLNLIEASHLPSRVHLPLDFEHQLGVHISGKS